MRIRTFLGTLFETEGPKPWTAPAPRLEPTYATSRDLELIAALIEWRDARQPYEEAYKGPCTTLDGRRERQAKWERYSKAEARLMEMARRLPTAEPRRRIAA